MHGNTHVRFWSGGRGGDSPADPHLRRSAGRRGAGRRNAVRNAFVTGVWYPGERSRPHNQRSLTRAGASESGHL
jgi:hypothetical protein